jgi:excisionase family DNA binding protein
MPVNRDDIMTMDELAEYLKISKSTLYKLAQENKLPGQKIGKRWRFAERLDVLLAKLRHSHSSQFGDLSAYVHRHGRAPLRSRGR